MLLSNSRISKNNKIRFYEQDMLIDDHSYKGNIQVLLDVEYVSAGIGIAFILDEGLSNEKQESFLFRIGHSDYSIVRSSGANTEIIENGPVINIKPYKSNLKLMIKKINNKFQFWVNDELLTNRYLPAQVGEYKVAYYSNAGNGINCINIASEIPDSWVVNMTNTNGGYVSFKKNSFTISNCSDTAEVEQNNIELKKCNSSKKYYLKYSSSDNSDIVPYVFLGNDDRYNDDEKNILNKDGSFILKKDDIVTLKFKGTIGTISDIQLSSNKSDFYIGTDYFTTDTESSYINIALAGIKKINIKSTIYAIPDDNKYFIIKDELKSYTFDDVKISLGKEYEYEILVRHGENKSLLVAKCGNEASSKLLSLGDFLYLFDNVDTIISKIEITKTDGTVANIIGENTKKQYIPAAINSPIIVTTDMGEPLDLSSSYRNHNGKFLFTNIEREIFDPSNRLTLERKPSLKLDTIKIYGILKDAKINEEHLMDYQCEGIDSIKNYANLYEVIEEKDIYSIDKKNGVVILTDMNDIYVSDKYKQLVVDYLKEDSYAINYKHEFDSYEVEISTNSNTNTFFDGATDMDNGFVNINNYKIFDSKISNNSYIVLRGGI